MTAWILVAGVLLLASALLSAAETAAFSPSPSRVRTLQEEGFKGADALATIREDPSAARLTLGFLETLLNIGFAAIVVYLGVSRGGGLGVFSALAIAVPIVLVFGEVVPRALARRRPVRFALGAAPLLLSMERIIRPVLAPLSLLESRIANGGDVDEPRSDQERVLSEMADLGRREGVLGEEENQLVERAFRLDELTVWEVMTPRVDIFSLPDSLTVQEITDRLSSIPYSRVPVYGASVDDITGILHVREAYETLVSGKGDQTLKAIAREPIFIPSSLSLTRCLRLFQLRRIHMGIVADEFGGTDGLVTLEDVVEELVGEIEDETDLPEVSLIRIGKGEAIADGSAELREVNKALNTSLPLDEHRSLNGLILEELGRVPEPGDQVVIEDLKMEVVDASETQVLRVRLTKPDENGQDSPES